MVEVSMQRCDGCIITCMDWRTHSSSSEFVKQVRELIGYNDFDVISIPGGTKNVVDETTRAFALSCIESSLRYHQIHTMVLFNHTDCSAYGSYGSLEKISSDLKEAKRIVSEQFPQLNVVIFIAHLSQNGKEWTVECVRPMFSN